MASRAVAEKWLAELTHLPTASGHEDAVVRWVEAWAGRRSDLRCSQDSGGNLLISQRGRKRNPPVISVAHMDHPAFVVTGVDGRDVQFEFRGGVDPEYFATARVRTVSTNEEVSGRVVGYDAGTQTGVIRMSRRSEVGPGDIAMWAFRRRKPRAGRFLAPACDDLAGAAAALAALDRARRTPDLRHFGVMLTRAEEMGFVGAIHASREGTLPGDARLLSIEASRASDHAPMGGGPVIRVGDATTVFDRELTNLISRAAAARGIVHQRKLMDGGSCEASAFGVYGYRATGLCLPLGNWHNRGNLDEFEAGTGEPIPMLEEISLDDYHGLISLLLVAADAVDQADTLRDRFDALHETTKHVLN